MSKSQALGWAIVCGIVTICCYLIPGLSLIGTAALLATAGFSALWFAKLARDRSLAEQAKAATRQPLEVMPSVTSPGNSRLFIPPPLDRA